MIKIVPATLNDKILTINHMLPVFCSEEADLEYLKSVDCYVLKNDSGFVGAVVGFEPSTFKGVFRVWSITTEFLKMNPLGFTRSLNSFITTNAKEFGAHRLEMTVKENYKAGHRWAEALKFQKEGVLRSFGIDKSDYAIYGRVL